MFFSDDNPFASWYHDSRIIYVSAIDGAYTISNVEIYPKGLSSDYEEISTADRPDLIAMDGTPFVTDPEKVASNYNYALIIVSMDNPRNWFNTSLTYNVLKDSYNYQVDNIFVLYSWDGNSTATPYQNNLDGPEYPDDDFDGPATYANIIDVITDLSGEEDNFDWIPEMKHSDQLAIFFTGVPVQAVGPTVLMGFPINANELGLHPVSDISQAMESIDCGQMIINFDVNSATEVSSFFEATGNLNTKCQNRFLTGSTSLYEKNPAEMYFSGGNYSEQLFYWASAARGVLPDVSTPWIIWEEFGQLGTENNGGGDYQSYIANHPGDDILDTDDDNYIQMGEAFAYANKMNTWTDDSWCYLPVIPRESSLPSQTDEISFIEDLLSLSGISGHVVNSQVPQGNFITHAPLVIEEGVSLSFGSGSKMNIHGDLISYQASSLSLPQKTNINSKDQVINIDINNGSFSIGENSIIGDGGNLVKLDIENNELLAFNNVAMNKCHCTFMTN